MNCPGYQITTEKTDDSVHCSGCNRTHELEKIVRAAEEAAADARKMTDVQAARADAAEAGIADLNKQIEAMSLELQKARTA